MKLWFEAELESNDESKECCKCKEMITAPSHLFVEFELVEGGIPHPDELHPEPTGKIICATCGTRNLW